MSTINKNNTLNNEEKAILIGGLLGDAVLVRRGENSYRYRVAHSIHQADYVYWKHGKLINICRRNQPPKVCIEKGKFERIEFYTDSGNYLKEIHELMYKKLPNVAEV